MPTPTVPLIILASFLAAAAAAAQEQEAPASRDEAPLIYIDCRRCDTAHIRQEITFVNYVRDPGLANVYVLITDQPTGSGGRMYTLAFTGSGPFAGVHNTLSYAAAQSATTAEARDGLTQMIGLGLVLYAARTPLAQRLVLGFRDAGRASAEATSDRWNSWTFEVYGGGNLNVEAT
jgi:hypothetical protein